MKQIIRGKFNQEKADTSLQKVNNTQKIQKNTSINKIKETLKNFSTGKPTNAEAQRIMTIIENLLEKVNILSYLDKDFIYNFLNESTSANLDQNLYQLIPKDLLSLLKTQAKLEYEYTKIGLGKTQDGETDIIGQDGIITDLKKNTKNLISRITKNDKERDIIERLRGKSNQDVSDFYVCLQSLKAIYLKKLSTAAEEEKSHINQMKELRERNDDLERTRSNKESELMVLKKQRQDVLKEKQEEIDKLRAQKKQIEENEVDAKSRLTNECQKRKEVSEQSFKEKEAQKLNKLKELKKVLKDTIEANSKKEVELKKELQLKESQLKDNIDQYDQYMDVNTKEYNELSSEYQSIISELESKEQYYRQLEEEHAREAEIERNWAEKLAQLERNKKMQIEAAKYVLQVFRNYKALSKIKPKKTKKPKK